MIKYLVLREAKDLKGMGIDIDTQFPVEDIPVIYEFDGKPKQGALHFVHGAAAFRWDLTSVPERDGMAIRFWHIGRLRIVEPCKWELIIKNKKYPELAMYLEAVLI